MNFAKNLNRIRERRVRRVRAKIYGTGSRPRLAVSRSNAGIYAQLIDDTAQKTLAAASWLELDQDALKKTKSEVAFMVGELLAKKAKEKGITTAVFDRRSYAYHGRVKALADGARKGGLKI
jgi:large subunit ribosomal protein L18